MTPERRTLEELVLLYELESTLLDIYVEGDSDRDMIEWFLEEQDVREVTINTVEYVDVPADLALGKGFEDNNRGRLITVAEYLETQLGADFLRATCIVDGDFDLVYKRLNTRALLMLTDYTSMEMYCFNPRTLTKFLRLAIGNFPETGAQVIQAISPGLQDLFTVRMANQRVGWGLEQVSFEKCCDVDQGIVRLNLKEYVRRLLNKNNLMRRMAEFLQTIGECKIELSAEPRFQIHGHDFIELLTWYIKRHNGFGHVRKDVVEKALYSSLEARSLAQEELFKNILKRYDPQRRLELRVG
jgi:hypothetical protein